MYDDPVSLNWKLRRWISKNDDIAFGHGHLQKIHSLEIETPKEGGTVKTNSISFQIDGILRIVPQATHIKDRKKLIVLLLKYNAKNPKPSFCWSCCLHQRSGKRKGEEM